MLTWFRQGPSPHQTALAMIGAKSGDHVLVAGPADPALVAEIAQVTGLNGQTVAAGPAEAHPSFEEAAAKAGALVDFVALDSSNRSTVPTLPHAPDIVVLVARFASMTLDARGTAVGDAISAVRPGGRIIAIDGERRGGFLKKGAAPRLPTSDVVALLTTAGAVAARALGEEPGLTYYEARRAR